MSCLILGNHTQGLGIIRSLFHADKDMHLVNDKRISLSRFSRYLKYYHYLPGAALKNVYVRKKSERLLDLIRRLVPSGSRWPVFCVHEDLVDFLYRNRSKLIDRIAFPYNNYDNIIDKFSFARNILETGLHTPETYLLSDFDEGLLKKGIYMCKGRIGNRFRNLLNLKGKMLEKPEDVLFIRNSINGKISEDSIIVQQRLSYNREVLSCCGFAVEGKLYRHFQYVKLRQHPDEFGTGTFLKSIRDSSLLELTLKILEHFKYTGIFEMEFLSDGSTYSVLEMNPRTWKSIHFATLCGQNMCLVYHDFLSHGILPYEDLDYSVGKTWVDLGTDIPMLLKAGAWLNHGYNRNTFFCVLNRKDPLPFLIEIFLAPLIKMDI